MNAANAASELERSEGETVIPKALWDEAFEKSWVTTELHEMHRGAAARLGRRIEVETRVIELLEREERHGPLPWPFGPLLRAVRRWAARDLMLQAEHRNQWEGTKRSPGRPSRLAAFVKYLLERHPELPRSPEPWLRACDLYGSPESEWVPCDVRATWNAKQSSEWDRKRRALWRPLLRRSCANKSAA